MEVITPDISGLVIIKPTIFGDNRGFFLESYNKKRYEEAGINADFIQDNISKSSYGVIRGLHYQLDPFAQAKLVQVIDGKVLDVAVDIRKGSPTFGQHYAIELSAENKTQFFVPRGFAHGFSVLSETATFMYKCDNLYNPEAERSILYNDDSLNIDWKIPMDKANVSDKDLKASLLKDAETNFKF